MTHLWSRRVRIAERCLCLCRPTGVRLAKASTRGSRSCMFRLSSDGMAHPTEPAKLSRSDLAFNLAFQIESCEWHHLNEMSCIYVSVSSYAPQFRSQPLQPHHRRRWSEESRRPPSTGPDRSPRRSQSGCQRQDLQYLVAGSRSAQVAALAQVGPMQAPGGDGCQRIRCRWPRTPPM